MRDRTSGCEETSRAQTSGSRERCPDRHLVALDGGPCRRRSEGPPLWRPNVAGATHPLRVAKTDAGRFVLDLGFVVTFTCEDATTQDWGLGWGFAAPGLPLTDGALLDFDDVRSDLAIHLHGRIGQHRGSGTLKATIPALTVDEQPQLCTSGDLTWQVEFKRTLTRASSVSSPALDGVMKIRVAPDGEVSTRVRSSD